MPGVVVYRCPDGRNVSIHSDLRDCPVGRQVLDIGTSGDRPTRFLGARGFTVTEAEFAELMRGAVATAPPPELDRKRLLGIGLAAFTLVLMLFLFAKRRRRS